MKKWLPLIACFFSTVAHAADARLANLQLRLNPDIREPYRLSAMHAPDGRSVEIVASFDDRLERIRYERDVNEMAANPSLLAARAASLGLLGIAGSPAVENLGLIVLSPSDQLPVVAGLSVVYDRVNTGRIAEVEGTLAFDGHVHTGRSHDGGDSYEAVLLRAAARGLDAVAITEHNEFDYGRIAAVLDRLKKEGRVPRHFILVPGEEVSTADGHVLAYFIHAKIEGGMSAGETIRAIHAQGGLAVAAHPSGSGGVGMSAAESLPFDGIEVISGANVLPVGLLSDLQASEDGLGKWTLASSDAHAASGVGVLYSRVESPERTLDGLRRALRRGRVKPVVDNGVYRGYMGALASPMGRSIFWPIVQYLSVKGRVLQALAGLLQLDRISLITTWEDAVIRMANGIFLPGEAVRLAAGTSDLSKPVAISSLAMVKGPLRLSYEQSNLWGYARQDPMWKLEARMDF